MSYLLIDPPVTPLSSPAEIQGWIDDLLHMAQDEAFANTPAEQQITRALKQARAWHSAARGRDGSQVGAERHAPSRP